MSLSEILLSALGVVLTGLASWAVGKLTAWINTKIKNEKATKFATEILAIATSAVESTYQTYVESIKGTDLWDVDAQKTALQKSLDTMKSELTDGAKNYIADTYGNVNDYLVNLVESTIYQLKNNNNQ